MLPLKKEASSPRNILVRSAKPHPAIPIQVPNHSPNVWIRCENAAVAVNFASSLKEKVIFVLLPHHKGKPTQPAKATISHDKRATMAILVPRLKIPRPIS